MGFVLIPNMYIVGHQNRISDAFQGGNLLMYVVLEMILTETKFF